MNVVEEDPHLTTGDITSSLQSIDDKAASQSSFTSTKSLFEIFFEDQSKIDPKSKVRLILACCMSGLVKDFAMSSLQSPPFSTQNQYHIKPNKSLVSTELKRRDPSIKNISQLKINELMLIMNKSNETYLTEDCISFILSKFHEYKAVFQGIIDAKNQDIEKVNRFTSKDRLRFIEALCTDDVRDTYRLSQNVLMRVQLNSKNSNTRDLTFHEKITQKFNDHAFIPVTTPYPQLHSDFAESITLHITEYVMNAQKAKDLIADAKSFLYKMIDNYEKSEEGAMSRKDTEADWGKFDIVLCHGNDDRSRFLYNHSASYLLYWWKKLDEYNLVSFTCHHLPDLLTATSNHSPSISSLSTKHNKSPTQETSRILADNIRLVGKSMSDMVTCQTNEQIENLEDSKMNLELRVYDMDEATDGNKNICIRRRIEQISHKITVLEENIAKKPKHGSPSKAG